MVAGPFFATTRSSSSGMILFHSSLIPLQLAGLGMMPMLAWAILQRDW
jgi:hypothetical protein